MAVAAEIIDLTDIRTGLLEDSRAEHTLALIEQMRAQGLAEAWETANPDYSWGRQLRDRIEEGLELLASEQDIHVSAFKLRSVHGCEGAHVALEDFEWQLATASRQLLPAAYELLIAGTEGGDIQILEEAFNERAQERWSLGEYLSGLNADERRAVIGEVLDEFSAARALIESLPALWKVRSARDRTVKIRTLGPEIVLRPKADLMLGPVKAPAVVDLRLSLNLAVREDLRFYALGQTIANNLAPSSIVGVGLGDVSVSVEPVTLTLLEQAADRIVDGVLRMAALDCGTAPTLRPGRACGWCPRRQTCPKTSQANANYEVGVDPL